MDTCGDGGAGGHGEYVATRFRDGLIIATLISCPVRLKNLEMIWIGKHLVSDGDGYELRFEPEETKMWQPHRAPVPAELTPYMERYLREHRPALLQAAKGTSCPTCSATAA